MGLDKVLIVSSTFRVSKPSSMFLVNTYTPVCKVNCFFVWWRDCEAHGWDHSLIPSGANDLPFRTVRVVGQNTFIIFVNGYLVLNEDKNNPMRSLPTNSLSYPILECVLFFEVENFTSGASNMISFLKY